MMVNIINWSTAVQMDSRKTHFCWIMVGNRGNPHYEPFLHLSHHNSISPSFYQQHADSCFVTGTCRQYKHYEPFRDPSHTSQNGKRTKENVNAIQKFIQKDFQLILIWRFESLFWNVNVKGAKEENGRKSTQCFTKRANNENCRDSIGCFFSLQTFGSASMCFSTD